MAQNSRSPDNTMSEQHSLTENINIKEESENYDLTVQIKPENEQFFDDSSNNDDDDNNPFQNVQLEIKQENQSSELADVLSNIEIRLNKKISEYTNSSAKAAGREGVKQEKVNPEMISEDYRSLDEGSMDSNQARALNNVEACLQEDAPLRRENYQVNQKGQENVKNEMGMTITETHLITNKLINTTSTVTMPYVGIIESQTTKTLVMEIHPMASMANELHKLGNPEEILPTSYNDNAHDYQDVFQLNSITGNILSLEQQAYSLKKTKKNFDVTNSHVEYACNKCSKIYKSAYTLKKHMSVHDTIERRTTGIPKGIKTRIENRTLKHNIKNKVVKGKLDERNIDTEMHRLADPEEILPTPYNDNAHDYQDLIQLNSITGNILSLEQEAYGLLRAKKKIDLNNTFKYKCEKCPKSYRTAHNLNKHMSVHDTIERRARGVLKGLKTRIENRTLKHNIKKKVVKDKVVDEHAINVMKARKERLERRLKNINQTETNKIATVKNKTEGKKKTVIKKEEKVSIKIKKIDNIKKEGYECTCGQIFQRKSRMETCLRSHNLYEATSVYFPCLSCSKQFKDKDELALHRKRLHRKRFPCKFCPTDYNTRKELFKHLQIHQKVQLMEYKVISEYVTGNQKLRCFMCAKTFSELSELKFHVMEDHKEPYQCRHCQAAFSKIIDFCDHIKTSHPEIEGKSVLDVLEAFSNLVKAWKCEECELQFLEADKLAMHKIEKHSPELRADSQVQCTDCHRVFVSQKGLTSHRRIHHNTENVEESEAVEKGVLCVECRKVCKDVDALNSHMRLHSPERKYPCKFCDFRFTTPEKRKAHAELHTGDMKYVCFICEYQCSSENRLNQHKLSSKHSNMKEFLLTGQALNEEPSTSKKESSSKDSDVKRRKKDKDHSSEHEETCDVCGDKFPNRKKMLKHKEKHPFIEFPNDDTPTRIFFK